MCVHGRILYDCPDSCPVSVPNGERIGGEHSQVTRIHKCREWPIHYHRPGGPNPYYGVYEVRLDDRIISPFDKRRLRLKYGACPDHGIGGARVAIAEEPYVDEPTKEEPVAAGPVVVRSVIEGTGAAPELVEIGGGESMKLDSDTHVRDEAMTKGSGRHTIEQPRSQGYTDASSTAGALEEVEASGNVSPNAHHLLDEQPILPKPSQAAAVAQEGSNSQSSDTASGKVVLDEVVDEKVQAQHTERGESLSEPEREASGVYVDFEKLAGIHQTELEGLLGLPGNGPGWPTTPRRRASRLTAFVWIPALVALVVVAFVFSKPHWVAARRL